jgi:hypothetical protein
MNDLVAGILIVVAAYLLFKIVFPTKVPDLKFCKDDACWSTKQLAGWDNAPSKPKPTDMGQNTINAEMSQASTDGSVNEQFTTPRGVQKDTDRLQHVVNSKSGMTLNYQVKYSKE